MTIQCKKLRLVSSYKRLGLDSTVLIIHNRCFGDIKILNILHNELIAYLETHNCEYDKVYLIDFLEHKGRFLSKVFEKGRKVKRKVVDFNVVSETRTQVFAPVGKEIHIWNKYK